MVLLFLILYYIVQGKSSHLIVYNITWGYYSTMVKNTSKNLLWSICSSYLFSTKGGIVTMIIKKSI